MAGQSQQTATARVPSTCSREGLLHSVVLFPHAGSAGQRCRLPTVAAAGAVHMGFPDEHCVRMPQSRGSRGTRRHFPAGSPRPDTPHQWATEANDCPACTEVVSVHCRNAMWRDRSSGRSLWQSLPPLAAQASQRRCVAEASQDLRATPVQISPNGRQSPSPSQVGERQPIHLS